MKVFDTTEASVEIVKRKSHSQDIWEVWYWDDEDECWGLGTRFFAEAAARNYVKWHPPGDALAAIAHIRLPAVEY